jgi:microcystin-dependent protein
MEKEKIVLIVLVLLLIGFVFFWQISGFFAGLEFLKNNETTVLAENQHLVVPDTFQKEGYFLSNEAGQFVWLQVPKAVVVSGGGGKGITGGFGITSIDQPDTMLVSLNLTDFNNAGDLRWADKNLSFLDLNDTPNTYVGQDGNLVRVKIGGGLEFVDINLATSDVNNASYLGGYLANQYGRIGVTPLASWVWDADFNSVYGRKKIDSLSSWLWDSDFNSAYLRTFIDTNWQTSFGLLDQNLSLSYYKQADANAVFLKTTGGKLTGLLNGTDGNFSSDVNANRFCLPDGNCNSVSSSRIPTWKTSIAYESGDIVIRNYAQYLVIASHTSGVFTTDLLNGNIVGLSNIPGDMKLPTTRIVQAGWIKADGGCYSSTTYPDLNAFEQPIYGSCNSGSGFLVPDFNGRMPIGVGTGTGITARDLNQSGGSETHTQTAEEAAQHLHTTQSYVRSVGGDSSTTLRYTTGTATQIVLTAQGTSTLGSGTNNYPTSGATAMNIMNPFTVVNFIIKT